MRQRSLMRGFTLVELLVVIAVMALLIAIFLPSMRGVRERAVTAKCLSNMRNMQIAHFTYATEHNGRFIDVGLSHGGSTYDPEVAWINTLKSYYGSDLVVKSPADRSPHWPAEQGGQGVPVPPSTDRFRRTSYGVNNFMSRSAPADPVRTYDSLAKTPVPSATIHFLIMAEEGSFAGADHPHVENWWSPGNPDAPPILASAQVATGLHGGKARTWEARSNYGFLDGHAETLLFAEVYRTPDLNRFDPTQASRFVARLSRDE